VHVLEYHEQRPLGRQASDDLRHRLEQPHVVFRIRRRARRVAELWEEARHLGHPRRVRSALGDEVRDHPPGSQGVDPGPEGQDLFTVVRATEQHATTAAEDVADQLRHQPTLAGSGVTQNHGNAAVPLPDRIPGLAQVRDFGRAPDQRGRRHDRGGAEIATVGVHR
jgi:hypothetical protein